MKNYFKIFLAFILLSMPVYAFEDCIMSTNGKLTEIKIQHNDIIDVFPLITIMNDKNTLIIHPLKKGESKFSVVKNEREKVIFTVVVNDTETYVTPYEDFDILTIDCPPDIDEYIIDIDEPPYTESQDSVNDKYVDDLESPPVLRGVE